MATLKELQDGTYSIEDVALMNEILDLKAEMAPKPPSAPGRSSRKR